MKWQELKGLTKPERCRILINEYLECKSFKVMGRKYYVNYKTITNAIESNRHNISDDSELQGLYKKMDELKAENMKTRRKKGFKDEFDEMDEFRILDSLPKEIRYLKFLDVVAEVMHSKASMDQWLQAAEERGIKVIN